MPAEPSKHRLRRGVAGKFSRSQVRGALIALAAFVVVMVIVVVAATTGGSSTPAGTASAPSPTAAPANWKLAFSTDFPGNTLDTSTWAKCYPWSPMPPGCTNFGNADEAEWYLPSQVHVENGKLALVAQRTPTPGSDEKGNPKTYTCRSGMVTTYPSVHFKYGYVQVVARLPFGKGLWPAIWLIPQDGSWPPEIDMVEHWDTELESKSTLHMSGGGQQRGTLNFPQGDQGWHTYTLYWTQSRISIYYDNQLAFSTTSGIPEKAMYLLLDLADENTTPGSCSGTMYVKSVNIWTPPQSLSPASPTGHPSLAWGVCRAVAWQSCCLLLSNVGPA
jgi:beta-glucanase (GH16 family)